MCKNESLKVVSNSGFGTKTTHKQSCGCIMKGRLNVKPQQLAKSSITLLCKSSFPMAGHIMQTHNTSLRDKVDNNLTLRNLQ